MAETNNYNGIFMKRLFATAALALCCAATTATAAPIVGNTYLDSDNQVWTYIGFYNVASGAQWSTGGMTYNGIEAATLVFGAAAPGSIYAISTVDNFVNHLAWYDGYGQTQHLNFGGNVGLGENINEDIDGDGYTFVAEGQGDWSAYVHDHNTSAVDSDNYVFTRLALPPVDVPEPGSIALTLLGVAALGAARRKKV